VSLIQFIGSFIVGLILLASDGTAAPSRSAGRSATTPKQPVLVAELERLTEGLLFMSERDFPISVVKWAHPGGRPTARRIATLVGEPHPERIEQRTIDEFFHAVVTPAGSPDAEEEALVRRYSALVRFLKLRLEDVRVFRFGRTTIRSYVVGVAPNGDWIGLTTTQTET
jgi:hypothetical protein